MPLVLAFPCEWYWYIIIYYYYVIDSMFLSPTHNPNPNTTKLEVLSSFKMNTILTACVESLVVSKAKHAYTFSLQKFKSHIFNLMPFTRTRSHIIYLYIYIHIHQMYKLAVQSRCWQNPACSSNLDSRYIFPWDSCIISYYHC